MDLLHANLATQEAEIKRIMACGQPRQKVSETMSQPINQAWDRFTSVTLAMQEAKIGGAKS
jgi:hypothetical protein